MSDLVKLIKKKPCPSLTEARLAERGERAEGVQKALQSGRGDVVTGAKKLKMDQTRPKLKPALAGAKRCSKAPPGRK